MQRVALLVPLAFVAAGCFSHSGGKSGGGAAHHTVVLTMASQISGGPPSQILAFANEVNRRSHGTMRLVVRNNWRARDLEQEADTIADVRSGRVDLAWVGARAWDWVGVKSFDPLVAPFLVDSYDLEQRVFDAGIPQRMVPTVSRASVVGIGVLPGPLRTLVGVRRPLLAPRDLRGRTIGVQGVVAAATFAALGAAPRQYYAQPTLAHLDGIEEQLSAILGNSHDNVARFVSANVVLWPRPLVLFAGRKVYDSLTPDQRITLRAAAAGAVSAALAASRHEDAVALRALCARGRLTFVAALPAHIGALHAAVAPVYRRLESDPGIREVLRRVERLRRSTPAPAPLRCASAPTQRSAAPSPMDGSWTMHVTRSDLVGNPAYGRPATSDDLRLDAGTYRLTLDRGRFEFFLFGGGGISHDVGTTTIQNDTVLFHVATGHDVGEDWSYRWSMYRDRLTFRLPRVVSAAGPPNMMFEPWRRAAMPATSTSVSQVIGAWSVGYSRAEYAAAGADSGELQERENWGSFVLTLSRDGTFTLRKTDAPRHTSGGRYELSGGTLVLVPSNGTRDAGSTWPYRWRIYRGRLSLARGRATGPDGTIQEPTGFVVKPFVRLAR
ncbi:MAG: hypothetical protein ACJ77E_15935 [Gaiellaceae bacterium]